MCSPTWALSERSNDSSVPPGAGSAHSGRAGIAAARPRRTDWIFALAASLALWGCELDSDARAMLGRGSDAYVDGREREEQEPSATGTRRPRGTAGAGAAGAGAAGAHAGSGSGGSSGAAGGGAGRASPAPSAGGGGGADASAASDSDAAVAGRDDAGPDAAEAEGGDVQDVPAEDPADEGSAPSGAGGDDDDTSGDDEAGGRERDGARNQGEGSTNAFFDALLTLIQSILQLDPVEASSQLLALLSAATGLDPEALGGLILWIDEADLCRDDPTLCEVACGLLEGRCSACAEQETCREAVERVCDDRIDACY